MVEDFKEFTDINEIEITEMQKSIIEQYEKEGHVFAMCPRTCGKTVSLFKIAYEEMKKGNVVYFIGHNDKASRILVTRLKNLIPESEKQLRKLIKVAYKPKRDGICMFDEFYFRQMKTFEKPFNFNITNKFAVVGTYPYKRFVFGFDAFPKGVQNNIIKNILPEYKIGSWEIEFCGGILNAIRRVDAIEHETKGKKSKK